MHGIGADRYVYFYLAVEVSLSIGPFRTQFCNFLFHFTRVVIIMLFVNLQLTSKFLCIDRSSRNVFIYRFVCSFSDIRLLTSDF